jgi:hypothetical protein
MVSVQTRITTRVQIKGSFWQAEYFQFEAVIGDTAIVQSGLNFNGVFSFVGVGVARARIGRIIAITEIPINTYHICTTWSRV